MWQSGKYLKNNLVKSDQTILECRYEIKLKFFK